MGRRKEQVLCVLRAEVLRADDTQKQDDGITPAALPMYACERHKTSFWEMFRCSEVSPHHPVNCELAFSTKLSFY